MRTGELLELIENPTSIQIRKDEQLLYAGYLGILRGHYPEKYEQISQLQVERFRVNPEIRHRRWKELNLLAPIQPEEAPDYEFKDLQVRLYYQIEVRKSEEDGAYKGCPVTGGHPDVGIESTDGGGISHQGFAGQILLQAVGSNDKHPDQYRDYAGYAG